MTVCLIATLNVQDGKSGDFEQLMADLTRKVRAEEPGCIAYQLTKSRTEAHTYKVLEVYKDQAARAAHGQSAHFQAAFPAIRAVLAGPPSTEELDGLD